MIMRDFAKQDDYLVRKRGEPILNAIRLAVVVMVVTSSAWALILHFEREQSDKLLADTISRQARVEKLTLKYANGAMATVSIKEAK